MSSHNNVNTAEYNRLSSKYTYIFILVLSAHCLVST